MTLENLGDAFHSVASAIVDRLDRVDISPDEIREALDQPDSFGYSGDLDLFETWSLGPVIRTRDSRLLDQSNADATEKHLTEDYPALAAEWEITTCNHWAVGWVDHLSFRAVDAGGEPTPIFYVLKSWFDALAVYPVADESDYSGREYDATIENIESAGFPFVIDEAPDEWSSEAFSWFWDHDQSAVESVDDQGGYPSDDQIKTCLASLGYLSDEYLEDAE